MSANTSFVPRRESSACRYNQKPLPITRSEARDAAEKAELLRDSKFIIQRAIARGVGIRFPERRTP